jgi:hypothetical protein
MAAIHLLDLTAGVLRVACHVPVPDGVNDAGLSWPDVLVLSGRVTEPLLPAGDETEPLVTGRLVEFVRDAHPDPRMDADALQAHCREVYAGAEDALSDLLASLQVWGVTFDAEGAKPIRMEGNPQLAVAAKVQR